MSIGYLTVQGALSGSTLFFNEARNREDLSGGPAVSQLALFTGAGAAVGALLGLSSNAGLKLCPRAFSVATRITESFSQGCVYVVKSGGRLLLQICSGYVGGIVAVHANGLSTIAAKKAHIVANITFDNAREEIVACPAAFKTIKQNIFERMPIELPLETRNNATNGAFYICVAAMPAVIEEILFRGIIQDLALKRIPSYILKKALPGKETLLQTKTYTLVRLVLSSAAFSAFHLRNTGTLSDSYIKMQLIGACATGIIFGTIKETGLGLQTSIFAHAVHNVITLGPCLTLTDS